MNWIRVLSTFVCLFQIHLWSWLPIWLTFGLGRCHAEGEAEEGEDGDEEEFNDFLYHGAPGMEPVMDYIPPPRLNATNFTDRPDFLYSIHNGPRVVEYYAPWCPHCQHFRHHYAQFAKQITALAEQVGVHDLKIYAVSCTVNRNMCVERGIGGYPRLELFPAGSINGTFFLGYSKLHPFDILAKLGIQATHLNLQEETGSTNKGTKKQNKKKKSKLKGGHKKETQQHQEGEVEDPILKIFPTRTKEDIFNDAYLSFDFNLRNGIFTTDQPLSNKTRTHFSRWLELLQMTMPPGWQIHQVALDLFQHFDKVATSQEQLVAIVDKYPTPAKTWSPSCTKGQRGMGYTCGLWQLFHIMTMGVVEWNRLISDDQLEQLVLSPVAAADCLRNFVENFFGCDVCRFNFIADYDSCGHDRCHRLSATKFEMENWMQLPLWLFETHNAVNVRIANERAQREKRVLSPIEQMQHQWPPRQDCPRCWRPDGAWNEDIVYKYMRLEYWPEDSISDNFRAEGVAEEVAVESEEGNHGALRMTIRLVALILAVGLLVGWYAKRHERQRTGRHKKVDE